MQEPVEVVKMPRRAFLAWGSALVAGTLGRRAMAAPELPATVATVVPAEVISVGYGAPLLADTAHIIEAASLFAGDEEFVRRGARVTVFGLEGMESALAAGGIKSLALDVAYPGPDGAEPILVHAWRFVNGPAAHVSPRNSFVVPVGLDSGLSLILESEDCAGVRSRAVCRFTVGLEAGCPKLQRGMYALAPSDAFGWRGLAWRLSDGARPRLVQRGALEDAPTGPAFPCLAMTVDYPNSGADVRA
jgi:hypothetical protein